MKKIVFAICMLTFCLASNAQLIKSRNHTDESYTLDANGRLVKKADTGDGTTERKGLFSKDKTPIDEKYLAGACPEVNGKVEWNQTINTNLTAAQAYSIMQKWMPAFAKSNGMTQKSALVLDDPAQNQLVDHIQEHLIFEDKALSLDEALLTYNLIVTCKNHSVDVTIRNIVYTYEENRDGGTFPGEDMLSDKNALNKKKNGFCLGGYKKFRTKTIDRKDQIMSMIAETLK